MPSYLNIRKTNNERLQSCCKLLTYDHPRTVFLTASGNLYFYDLSERIVDILQTQRFLKKRSRSLTQCIKHAS